MDEMLWITSTDPFVLLDMLYPMGTHGSVRPQTRQCRLYLLACARRKWRRLPGVCHQIIMLGEVYADAPNEEEGLRAQVEPVAERLMNSAGERGDLLDAHHDLTMIDHASMNLSKTSRETGDPFAASGEPLTPDEWRGLAPLLYMPFEPNTPPFTWVPRQFHSCKLLHEIHGNPCRLVPFNDAWGTDTVKTLAQQMYDSREYGSMPILADALQDAECDNEEMLTHCRNMSQKHVRGCWVLDQVLGK